MYEYKKINDGKITVQAVRGVREGLITNVSKI